jgi:hypothetical protein
MQPENARQRNHEMSGCTKLHHPMLHKNNIVMDKVNVIDENKSHVILQIVPVKADERRR